jgi:hypothetical protein
MDDINKLREDALNIMRSQKYFKIEELKNLSKEEYGEWSKSIGETNDKLDDLEADIKKFIREEAIKKIIE